MFCRDVVGNVHCFPTVLVCNQLALVCTCAKANHGEISATAQYNLSLYSHSIGFYAWTRSSCNANQKEPESIPASVSIELLYVGTSIPLNFSYQGQESMRVSCVLFILNFFLGGGVGI